MRSPSMLPIIPNKLHRHRHRLQNLNQSQKLILAPNSHRLNGESLPLQSENITNFDKLTTNRPRNSLNHKITMKNKLTAIALTTLTLTASIAPMVVTQLATAKATETATWQLFSPKGEGFSILMPLGKIGESLEDGIKFFMFETDQEAFVVAHWGIQASEQEEILIEEIAKKIHLKGYKLISRRSFGLSGNPGIELNFISETQDRLTIRYIIARGTVYAIAVQTSSPERANTFLNSFRLR
jgi:hypothetical protein